MTGLYGITATKSTLLATDDATASTGVSATDYSAPTGATAPSSVWAQSYANQVSMDDDIFSYGAFSGTGSTASTYSTSFGGAYGTNYGPGSEVQNMSMADYIRYQGELDALKLDQEVAAKKDLKMAEFKTTSGADAITRQIGILQNKIKDNDQDNIITEYNKLIALVKAGLVKDGSIAETDKVTDLSAVKAYAEKLYFAANGTSIVDDIKTNGGSSFGNGITLGIINSKSSAETIAEITGTDVSRKDKFWKIAGTVALFGLGGVGILLGGGKLIKSAFK